MRINKILNTYVAMEATPGLITMVDGVVEQGGGVIASGPTPAIAILRCMIRKAAAYKHQIVMFDTPDPVIHLKTVCQCNNVSCIA
jgi:hypothetical protein